MKLFNDIDFKDFIRTAFERELARVDFKDTLDMDLAALTDKISKKLTFTVPYIEQSGIKSEIHLKDKENLNSEIPSTKEDKNSTSAFAVFKIPFSGNEEIFKISTDKTEKEEYDFEITGNYLEYKIPTQSSDYQIDESDKKEIIDQSADFVSYIEQHLHELEKDFAQFNQMLPHLISTALNEKKAYAIVAKRNEESINTFGKNS